MIVLRTSRKLERQENFTNHSERGRNTIVGRVDEGAIVVRNGRYSRKHLSVSVATIQINVCEAMLLCTAV